MKESTKRAIVAWGVRNPALFEIAFFLVNAAFVTLCWGAFQVDAVIGIVVTASVLNGVVDSLQKGRGA